MYNQDTDKKCPKCNKFMVKLGLDTSLASKWKCPGCGHEESKIFFDSEVEKNYGKR